MEACRFGRCDDLEVLLTKPNWIRRMNQVNGAGWSALFYGSIEGQTKAVAMLLDAKADPNIVEPVSKFTALHWAAKGNKAGTVVELLRHGADPNKKNKAGQLPKDIAKEDCFKILNDFARNGTLPAYTTPKSVEEHNAEMIAIMDKAAADAKVARGKAETAAAEAKAAAARQPAPRPVAAAPAATPARPKFCPECGAPAGDGKFCGECGYKF